jgi:hypothetical protein
MSPNFKDIEHEQFYEGNLRMATIPQDSYHKSLFYTLGISPQTRQSLTGLYYTIRHLQLHLYIN